jgi:hypothetical protein
VISTASIPLTQCSVEYFYFLFFTARTTYAATVGDKCPTYWVIGVRGSGESLTGANEIEKMQATVGAYVTRAAADLPSADTDYLSLPYLAAPVGLDYFESEGAGWQSLQAIITSQVRIGIVGYSQGAHVVNDALKYLSRNAASSLNNVRAVLQIADPRADPNEKSHVGITPEGFPARTKQHGGILSQQALPSRVQDRATSICISGDIVCDAANTGLGSLAEAALSPIHRTAAQTFSFLTS